MGPTKHRPGHSLAHTGPLHVPSLLGPSLHTAVTLLGPSLCYTWALWNPCLAPSLGTSMPYCGYSCALLGILLVTNLCPPLGAHLEPSCTRLASNQLCAWAIGISWSHIRSLLGAYLAYRNSVHEARMELLLELDVFACVVSRNQEQQQMNTCFKKYELAMTRHEYAPLNDTTHLDTTT